VKTIKQFLKSVYSSIEKRRDSYIELGMAVASAGYIESVVAVSESNLYRRRFSSIYDTLKEVKKDEDCLLKARLELFSETCKELSGYEVYSGDSTFIKRSEANTLEARVMKRFASGELAYGHETYWTTRLSNPETSWTGVALVERMTKDATVSTEAAKHLKRIDSQSKKKKLFVYDAGHGLKLLGSQEACEHSDIILRVKSHQVFYYAPSYQGRGRPAKYGERFKLSEVKKEAERQSTIPFKKQSLRISTWQALQAAKFMDTPLLILKLEFLNEAAESIFQKPIWLITTATELEPESIARAYLWRSSHELTFRFMKQHLGLTKNQSPELRSCDNWLALVAFAMNLLLASRDQLEAKPNPWYPQKDKQTLSQRQAQKQVLSFFLNFTSLIKPPQPAGKAVGRPLGHNPPARTRQPVTRKTPKRKKICPTCPLKHTD